MKRSEKRQHLLKTAHRLFSNEGFHHTGIDKIVAEAEIAKRTLYRHFPSKDHLVVEAIAYDKDSWCLWFEASVEKLASTPEERLFAMFEVLKEWTKEEDFAGGAFLKAILEFPDPNHPAHQAVREHDQQLRDIFMKWTTELDIANPSKLSNQLMLLVSGVIVESLLTRSEAPIDEAEEIAHLLLKNAPR